MMMFMGAIMRFHITREVRIMILELTVVVGVPATFQGIRVWRQRRQVRSMGMDELTQKATALSAQGNYDNPYSHELRRRCILMWSK